MPRKQNYFEEGDVVAYEGKAMYVGEAEGEGGNRKLTLYRIDETGHISGFGETVYSYSYGKVQLIDFAKTETIIHLPPEWQKTMVPAIRETDPVPSIDDEAPEAHPAYGVATVTRPSGMKKLFMSAMKHHHYISLNIRRALRRRGLSEDRTSQSEHLLEVHFSEAQWGRLLSSVGMGDGVPCTLNYVGGAQMPDVPQYDENDKFHEEVEADGRKAAEKVGEAIRLLNALMDKSSVTKADRKELLEKLQSARRDLADSMPFIVKQYDERMEKIVVDAKTEVESFLLNTAQRLGVERLIDANKAPELLLPAMKKGEE